MADTPDPERLAAARALYFDGKATVASIAASLGLTASAFSSLRKREGWPMRPSPIKPRAPTAPVAEPAPAAPPGDGDAQLTDRLERALVREVASFETSADPEAAPAGRNARILASLVKTLAELRKLEAAPKSKRRQGMPHDGEAKRPPRDLAALREDLAQKLADYESSRSSS